ncbi:MAG: hypothetical protein SOS24_11090 [Clostridia bacterium]|nr:hypothetical protein [Clostridia bacterium]
MKMYEMKWKPNIANFQMQIDIVNANSLEEATKMIEGKAKMLGATSIDWFGKREITKY